MLRPCLAALILAFSLPATALAWTSAKVRDVRAEIVVDRHGAAQVTLDIGVEVLGGWLERFDLDGLDEELTLPDAEAAWLTTAEGVVVPAQAESEGGAIALRFDKQQAARRGLHRVGVRYRAPIAIHASAADSSQRQLSWVLPGWEHGLSRAEIVVRGPKGLVAVRDPQQAVELTQSLINGQSVLTFVRVLVPRSTAWSVSAEGPLGLFTTERVNVGTGSSPRSVRALPWREGTGLVVLLWVVGYLSRAAFRRRASTLSASTHPWMASHVARRSLSVLFTLGALWGTAHSLPVMLVALLALASCFVEGVTLTPRSWPLGRFAPLGKAERLELRRRLLRERLGLTSVFDLATVVGAASACALLVFAVYRAQQDLAGALGLMCVLPLWAASSRLRLPRSTAEQVSLLVNAAEHALALSCGMRLVGFMVGEERVEAPRIRIVPSTRFSGLLRIDVAVDTRRPAPALVLIAVTQAGSVADHALLAVLGEQARELSPRGHRAAYVQPIEELGASLEHLLSTLAAYGQRTFERPETQRAA